MLNNRRRVSTVVVENKASGAVSTIQVGRDVRPARRTGGFSMAPVSEVRTPVMTPEQFMAAVRAQLFGGGK